MNIKFPQSMPRPASLSPTLQKRGSLFEFGLLVVMAGLFYWFVLSPKLQKVELARTQTVDLEKESEVLTQQKLKLDKLVNDLETSKQDISKLDQALPLNPRTTNLYILTESLVQSSGMAINNLAINNVDQDIVAGQDELLKNPFGVERKVKKMTATFGVTGTFPQFLALLTKLENSSRLFDIESLSIEPSADGLLDFRMAFTSYYFAP